MVNFLTNSSENPDCLFFVVIVVVVFLLKKVWNIGQNMQFWWKLSGRSRLNIVWNVLQALSPHQLLIICQLLFLFWIAFYFLVKKRRIWCIIKCHPRLFYTPLQDSCSWLMLKFAIFLEAFVEAMKFTDKSVQPAILWTNWHIAILWMWHTQKMKWKL